MRLRPEHPLSEQELLTFCSAQKPLRVEQEPDGELIVMSPGGTDVEGMELDVAAELRNWARVDGRGRAFGPNAGVTLPDGSVRAADAAWISWPRWNALSSEQQQRFAPACPEFVIELRSPSDSLATLVRKMEQWISNGAQLGWLIDPAERTISIYRPGEEPELHSEPTSVQGTGVMTDFELVMERVLG